MSDIVKDREHSVEIEETSELVRHAQEGDVRAFERLIARFIPQVRRFARSFTRSNEEADDLAQEALLRAYRAIHSYRFQSAFSTWLFRITRNVSIDAARRAARQSAQQVSDPRVAEGVADETIARQDDALVVEEEHKRLWSALGLLEPKFRVPLVLCEIEALSYEEVAAIEGVPIGTIRSRLARGRQHLRRLLEQMES